MTASAFEALPDAEKERIWQEIDRTPPEVLEAQSRPLNKAERALWAKAKKRLAKPKARTVAVKIDGRLVAKLDRLARREGVTREKIVARGVELLLRAS
jgi:hypothetical protein